jgi:multidrug efflux pump subunit AcrB
MSPVEAMFHAAEQRMRPMLMTALSACIGLVPAAFSTASAARCSGRWRPWSSAAC